MLKIGDAAKSLKVSNDTLRRWEKSGKITSNRTPSGYRVFSPQDLEKIKEGTTQQVVQPKNPSIWVKQAILSSLGAALVITAVVTIIYLLQLQQTKTIVPEEKAAQSDITTLDLQKDQSDELKIQLSELQDEFNSLRSDLSLAIPPPDTSSLNLIPNSSFEANRTGKPLRWAYTGKSTSSNTFVTQDVAYSGFNSLKFVGGTDYLGIMNQEAVTGPSRFYKVTFYLKSYKTGSFDLDISFWDPDKKVRAQTVTKRVNESDLSDSSAGWQLIEYRLTSPGPDQGKNWFPIIETPNLNTGVFYIDDVAITEVDVSGFAQIRPTGVVSTIGDGSILVNAGAEITPYLNKTGSLGTDSLRFQSLYLSKASIDKDGNSTLGGDLTVAGNTTLNGSIKVSGDTTLSGTTTLSSVSISGDTTVNDLFAANVISSSTIRDYVIYNGTSDTRGEFPVVIKLQNGSYFSVFRIGTSHASDNGRLVAYSSSDGKTWSSLGTITDDSTYDDRNPAVIQLSDGTIVVGYITYNYSLGSTVDMKVIKSTNNGVSWGSPISQGNTNSPYGHMIQLSNGHILMSVYGRQSGDTHDRAMLYRSTDNGTTFSVYSTIASSQGSEDINEAGIFKLSNGNIAAAIRTDTNSTTKMFFQTSTDNGATWDALNGLSSITGHSPDLIQMPSGRLYLFVRYNARRPNATAYYVSDDNGSTWFGPNLVKYVSPATSAGGGYPSAVKYNDDTIMVAYYDEVDRDVYATLMGDWPYSASLNIGARVAGPAIFGGGIMAGVDSNENLILTPSAKIYVANNKTFGFLGASGSGDSLAITVDTSNNATISTANGNPIYLMADGGGLYFQTYSGSWLTRMHITDDGNVGIGDTSPDALFDIDSTATTSSIFGILSTSLTTGEIADITATYAPTDGSTNEAIDINLTHTPTTLADNFSGIDLDISDGTALANTVYNYNGTLTLTGDAAKTGVGLYQTVTSSSTTADTLVSLDLATDITGIITTGTRSVYGLRSQPSAGAESTGGTTNVYGVYSKATADVAAGGTVNGYGLYLANGTYDTDGTSTQYGLHIEALSGADSNYDLSFASTSSQIKIPASSTTSIVDGTNTLFTVSNNVTTLDSLGAGAYINKALVIGDTNSLDNRRYTLFLNRTWTTSLVAGASLRIDDDITAGAGLSVYTARITPTALRTAATGTHALFTNLYVQGPIVTANGATVTDASTVYIAGPPTGITPTNPALSFWVDAGAARFDGAVAYGSQQTFTNLDATPDVSSGSHWITNTSAVTITDFDAGAGTLVNGQIIYVESNGAITYDVTSSGLKGGAADFVTAAGDLTVWIYDGTDWLLVNWVEQADTQSGGADLAEWYVSSEDLEPGDVVSVDPNDDVVVEKSNTNYDQQVMGIVSTDPGIILGSEEQHTFPIALAGRVPVKVSTENGVIQRGDYLTSSSTPGVAMKALKPGPVIGKALEEYSGEEVGKIITFVNISYADPSDLFSSLSLDDEGNLIVPKLKAESLTINTKIDLSLSSGKELLSFKTLSPDPEPSYDLDIITSIKNLAEAAIDTKSALEDLESSTASDSAKLAEQIASASAELAKTKSDIDTLKLTPPELLLATNSATLDSLKVTSQATFSGMLASYDLNVSNIFKSLGETILGNTTIAGDVTIDGTFSISGSSLNALPVLYLQNSSLAEKVDLFNGKVIIDKEGKLEMETLALGEASLGEGVIPAGEVEVSISSSAINDNSRIFITPTSNFEGNLIVSSQTDGSFKVSVSTINSQEIKFNWFVIQKKISLVD